jgi:uncharacterized protein
MPESLPLQPTLESRRIELIDILRGFALSGVLLINMRDVAYDTGATEGFDSLLSTVVEHSSDFFVSGRFLGLFSILFGLGFALQIRGAREKGSPFLGRYLRRAGILFLFGLAHSLLYAGDILKLYAVVGLPLLFMWKVPPRSLVALSVASLVIAGVGRPVLGGAAASLVRPVHDRLWSSQFCEDARAPFTGRREAYTSGSLGQVAAVNTCRQLGEQRFRLGRFHHVRIFALFLLGVLVGTTDFFRRIQTQLPRIKRWSLVFALTGFALLGADLLMEVDESVGLQAVENTAFLLGLFSTTLAYGGGVVLLYHTRVGKRLLRPLAALGRTALTVYLLQTVIYSVMFYGWGLQLQMSHAAILGAAAVIFAAEVVAFNLWLRYFHFGPTEWLWRSLTYARLQPLRKRGAIRTPA